MDLFNLWPMMGGDATAEEARQRRAQRWDEPAPVPAQILAGMAQPFTTFNEPGRDPVQMGADLGMLGISPFMGRIATAKPAMTAQEQLWKRAQEGDIHATGQLTGEMWQRDLKEMPPPPPDTSYPGDFYYSGSKGEPRQDFSEMSIDDFEWPVTGERHGDSIWTGTKWEQGVPHPGQPAEMSAPSMLRAGDRLGNKVWDGQQWIDMSPMPPAGPEGYTGPPVEKTWKDFLPPDVKDELDNLFSMPENLPWEGHIPQPPITEGPLAGQIPLHPDDPASGILRNSLSYDEWQQLLSQMQARPLPPGINPFAGQR